MSCDPQDRPLGRHVSEGARLRHCVPSKLSALTVAGSRHYRLGRECRRPDMLGHCLAKVPAERNKS